MSTFNGLIREFPDIRIDFFRLHRHLKPPTACFLSHIHSDHLRGLELPVLPFVYCSAATRRLLLRMEKYPHRINFAKGILEARKQTYKHLRKVLKALPLQTPTVIELTPKTTVRVTLFDANHCPGAVMFLIEGDGKAVLYTGDIRSETWWLNSLIRNPAIIPYTIGKRRLDCLYMDTTFAIKEDVYRDFPSKASGLAELIEKIEQYPPETIFYFKSWTLGYEDAWLVLASTLSSRIHVDAYQTRLYYGLLEDHGERISVQEAASLVGFTAGNHPQDGCLTDDSTIPVRIHSCEPGTACHASLSKKSSLVWITPIILRRPDGTEVFEVGAGGGGGDLYQTPELDIADSSVLQSLQATCTTSIKDPSMLENALFALEKMASSSNNRISLDGMGVDLDSTTDMTLKDFIAMLSEFPRKFQTTPPGKKLATTIHFPYSRHSSYNELRELVAAFKPIDICPCTVDLDRWNEDVSMQSLFGDLCSGQNFVYDEANREAADERETMKTSRKRKRGLNDEGDTQSRSQEGSEEFEAAEGARNCHEDGLNITAGKRTLPLNQQRALDELDTSAKRLKAIEVAFHALNDDQPLGPIPSMSRQFSWPPDDAPVKVPPVIQQIDLAREVEHENDQESEESAADTQLSQLSLSLSAFNSQFQTPPQAQPQIDGSTSPRPGRLKARIEAYCAAKASLDGDHGLWDELGIRSMGYTGHIHEEVEL